MMAVDYKKLSIAVTPIAAAVLYMMPLLEQIKTHPAV